MADDRNNGRFTAGNPGRRPGSRNKATLLAAALVEGEAEAIVRATITAALDGDVGAQRLLLERLLPPRRTRPVELPELPAVAGANDVQAAMAEVLRATANGEVTPDEGAALVAIVEGNRRAIETGELLARLEALEQAQAKAKGRGR